MKKIMKKILPLLLTALLLLTPLTPSVKAEGAGKEITVGSLTQMKGDFFSEMFGNGTADVDARALLHGYNLIHWDENQGMYLFDESVVKNVTATKNGNGDKVYTFTLYDDLKYSDGSPINASDYAFSLLLQCSKEVKAIGALPYDAEYILGYADYNSGKTSYLAGVKVLGDDQLSITLDHNYLPYFYELGLLLCNPYPIREIAPGCKVYSDEKGAFIGNTNQNVTEAIFTAELLQKTILDPKTGYRSHPKVVSGPFTLDSFDGVTAKFTKNDYFKGALPKTLSLESEPNGGQIMEGNTVLNWQTTGRNQLVKPSIEKITFTQAKTDTLVDDLKSGKLDLVNKVQYSKSITAGVNTTNAGKLNYTSYPRTGLSFVLFSCEKPTVSEMEVRQAIAWCLNRDALTQAYCGAFGTCVDSWYGIGRWEYALASQKNSIAANFDDESKMAGNPNYKGFNRHGTAGNENWESLRMNLVHYGVNVEKANALLNKAGWTENKAGGTYQGGKDAVRCKTVNGKQVALELTMLVPEGNRIVDSLPQFFTKYLNRCGIQLTVKEVPMADLLRQYTRETERTADMIYMATNINVLNDPALLVTTVEGKTFNNICGNDEKLNQLAMQMRSTNPDHVYNYVKKWIAFEERFNEVLPAIPVYSGNYYDFYSPNLQNYAITAHATWAQAILEAKLK